VANNNLYNLADFMLGLRSQYALSNALVNNLRRHMHFTYLQDDIRVNDRLTVNAGLRYEYATPIWEANNVLSNFDPATRQMLFAKDGSVSDRGLVDPDKNNFAPRLGLAYSLMQKTVLRGGYGISYVHVNRTGAADLLPINGPQVINAVVNQTSATDPSFRTTEQGYPAGITDPARFNPLTANISYIPRDFQSGRVQSWFASVQREIGPSMLLDLAYVGNKGDDLLLIANYNQARPNNAAGTLPLQSRRPLQDYADITYVFNGGRSRYDALQTTARSRSKTRTATSPRRRTSTTSAPITAPAPITSRTTARRASCGRSPSAAASAGAATCRAASICWSAAGSSPASTASSPARW
jgi:hypothetical protein